MEIKEQLPEKHKRRSLNIRAKLILGFSLLSAFISFITARGIYTNLREQITSEFNAIFVNQSILVFFVALGIGIFAGYVAGNLLTEPILILKKGATAFASGKLDEKIDLQSTDEIGDLSNAFNNMAEDIRGLVNELEQRVARRTVELENRSKELEIANENIQRRARQFESMAQVAQIITSIRDLKELLPRVTSAISEHFGFYHVGVFLVDESSKYAILAAANSEGGEKMLERRHRLKVGEQGIVGRATGTGEPRIALDVGADAVYFNNPDLPDTHSEMALPLRSGNKIIGALDVQSTEVGAFTNEDVQTLSLLADQVSLAIENARLFEDSNRTLADLQTIMRQSTRETWKRLPEQHNVIGYRYNSMGSTPITETVKPADPQTGKGKAEGDDAGSHVIPIELRGEVIGSLLVQSPSGDAWNDDERDLIKAVAERVALAAENARLFDETTQRAERERLVSEITGKIRSHNDPKTMIEIAVNELRNALGVTHVEVIPQSTGGKVSKV